MIVCTPILSLPDPNLYLDSVVLYVLPLLIARFGFCSLLASTAFLYDLAPYLLFLSPCLDVISNATDSLVCECGFFAGLLVVFSLSSYPSSCGHPML